MHPSFVTLKATRWAASFALILGIVLCALPLVGTIGAESSLFVGLLLSPWCSALGARLALRARTQRARTGVLLADALAGSWCLLGIPLALLALNALRVKTCDPWGGVAFVALGPWASVSLAALVGVAFGSSIPGPRTATTLAALFPLLEVGSALRAFVTTPGIFAFGHFFGYFPGTLYDRRLDIPDAWLSHRALGALLAAGLWAFLAASRDPRSGRLSFLRLSRHPVLAVFVVVAASGALLVARQAHALGHATSSAFIAHKLGLVIEGKRCRAVVPRELDVGEAARIAEDCEFRVSQIERTLGVRENQRVTAYFFRSPSEKRALMGAMRVYIAKPWRREAYLQLAEFPHPVLAHELAHVVARHAASGPFGVPGRLGGLIPEPTLVEGTAVALEPTARDDLTPHQWAKAAQAAKLAPSLSSLLGPRFFGTNQSLAYTIAGSFLRFVLDTRGAETLRRIYREGDVERVLGKSFAELEGAWKAYLAGIPLPPPAAALAKQRFERPGVFSQVCPHEVDRLEGEVTAALSAGDLERAVTGCRDVLAIDPKNTGTRATLAGALARTGELGGAKQELKALEGPPKAPLPTIARARVALADASFMRADFAAAEQAYRALLNEPQSESDLRQLEVKLLALEAGDPTRALVGELLIGPVGRPTDSRTAMHLIHQLYALRNDGLAQYLEARQLTSADRHDLAYPLVREALQRGLPTQRLTTEALRMRGLLAFLVGELADAEATYKELERVAGESLAEQLDARDFLARIRFRRRPR